MLFKSSVLVLLGLALVSAHVYFKDDFTDSNWEKRWVVSDWKQSNGEAGKWVLSAGKYHTNEAKERGLQTSQDARFYAISAAHEEFSNKGKTLYIQYSLKHEQNIDCGGGYIKLVGADQLSDQTQFQGGADETKYNVMFGPDVCGYTKKIHFILSKKGTNHLIKEEIPFDNDEYTHLYTAALLPDNTFKVYVDGVEKKSGSIPELWDILPPKKINDPSQSKPADWVDERLIDDPNDKKPEGYDDIPAEISDPDSTKPDDWDNELDGDWEAPKIPNPEFKGPWAPKRIENPLYKGPWVHPQIDNPEFKDDSELYAFPSFKYVGIDIWQVKSGSIFSHFLLTDDWDTAKAVVEVVNAQREAEKSLKEAADKEASEKQRIEAEKLTAEDAATENAEKEDL